MSPVRRPRVGVEVRRTAGSGIGRVTSLVCNWLQSSVPLLELIAFGPPAATAALPEEIRRVDWAASPFSREDLYDLPEVVAQHGLDLFVGLQFYTSPYIRCRQLRFIHDVWPLQRPDLLPSWSELEAHYGRRELVHTLGMLCGPSGPQVPERAIVQLAEALYETGMEAADAVVTVSYHVASELAALWPPVTGKLHVIYPIPDATALAPLGPARTADHGGYILHVSNWEPRKNQFALIEAVESIKRQFSGIRMIMVGDGVGPYRRYADSLRRTIAARRSGWLRHVGKPDDSTLWQLYRGARLVAQPSHDEGFGLPAFEAMWLGVPLVVATAGAFKEICGSAALYVDPDDPRSIADGLRDCWTNEHLRVRLSRHGAQRAQRLVAAQPSPRERFLGLVHSLLQTPQR
jgi:glycosyltransferase involved in cell wall biosynthesis